jgi:hypothetical protein
MSGSPTPSGNAPPASLLSGPKVVQDRCSGPAVQLAMADSCRDLSACWVLGFRWLRYTLTMCWSPKQCSRALMVSSYIASLGPLWRASEAWPHQAASSCMAFMQGAHLQCPSTVSNWQWTQPRMLTHWTLKALLYQHLILYCQQLPVSLGPWLYLAVFKTPAMWGQVLGWNHLLHLLSWPQVYATCFLWGSLLFINCFLHVNSAV